MGDETFGPMIGALRRVIVKSPAQAFGTAQRIAAEWQRLGFTAAPDLERASAEHRALVAHLRAAGAEVLFLPASEATTLDSLYVHDPALVTERGVVVLRTGKPDRRGEGIALAAALRDWGIAVLGSVEGDGAAEGGDMLWLDERTLVAGRGFRTNAAGIEQIRGLLAPFGSRVLEVDLPYWDGPEGLLHLLSVISPLDRDLAVVYKRLLPVPLFEWLSERGVVLLDVPEDEFPRMACNVLALAPRRVLMLAGLPATRRRLMEHGCHVEEYTGDEISHKGNGGPTCLTRPIARG